METQILGSTMESHFEALITPVTVAEKILEDFQQGNRFQQVAVSILINGSHKVACGEEVNIITSPSWGARCHVSHVCELWKLETVEFLGLYCLSLLINSANSTVIMRSLSKPVMMWHIVRV